MQSYESVHAPDCARSQCYKVEVPYEKLIRILENGAIPLVSIKEGKHKRTRLAERARKFGTTYSAISHVWYDGLGNSLENALPVCQVKRLQSPLAHKLNSWNATHESHARSLHQLFWMDTFCIPVKDEHQTLREQSIYDMSSIYIGAWRVIVLDAELMNTEVIESMRDLYAMLVSCVWMCRSWFLQGAILPTNCVFQLAEEVYVPLSKTNGGRIKKLQDEEKGSTSDPIYAALRTYFLKAFLQIRQSEEQGFTDEGPMQLWYFRKYWECLRFWHRRMGAKESHRFAFTWNALAGRSTTKAEDLYVVLASCLGFRLSSVLSISSSTERFQAIILSHKELLLSLFYNTSPRSYSKAHHHNRWLPTEVSQDTLSSDTTVKLPQIWNSRHCTSLLMLGNPKGPLSSSNTSICLVWRAVSNMQPFHIVIGHDRVYRIEPVIEPFDSFNVTAFSYTCFIFENLKRGANESAKGACFYFNGREEQEKISAGRADLELVFCYPLHIFREIPFQHTQLAAMCTAFETHHYCKVHIKFDPLATFYSTQSQGSHTVPIFMRARIELIYSAAVLSTSAVGGHLALTTMLNANWTPDAPSEAGIKNNTQSFAAFLVIILNIGLTLLLVATALFLVRFTHK